MHPIAHRCSMHSRGTVVRAFSPLLPSHTLSHSWSPFKADYPGPGWHPGPPQLLLLPVFTPRMHREPGGSGQAAAIITWSPRREPCSRHSLDPAALAKSPWSTLGAGGNLERCVAKSCILQRLNKELCYKAVLTHWFGGSHMKPQSRAEFLNLSQKQA